MAFAVDPGAGGQQLGDVVLLSLGTGFNPYRITADTRTWGAVQWAVGIPGAPDLPLLTILTDGVSEADSLVTAQLLDARYFRLNPPLPRQIPLDAYSKVPELVAVAERTDLEPVAAWLDQIWFADP